MSNTPATRDRILDTALGIVRGNGGTSLTMGEVASQARLSRQAVYLHFQDRAALLVAMALHAGEARNLPTKFAAIAGAPSARAASRNIGSLRSVRAWSAELETSRRGRQLSPVGPSKVVTIAKGAVRFWKV